MAGRQEAAEFGEVRARRLVITDDDGNERVEVSHDQIAIKDAGGAGRVLLGLHDDGGAFVQVHDSKGEPHAVVLVSADGAVSVIELGSQDPDFVQVAVDLREPEGERAYVSVGIPEAAEEDEHMGVIHELPSHIHFPED